MDTRDCCATQSRLPSMTSLKQLPQLLGTQLSSGCFVVDQVWSALVDSYMYDWEGFVVDQA